MRLSYGARALHEKKISILTSTQNINNYYCHTATMVTRTRLKYCIACIKAYPCRATVQVLIHRSFACFWVGSMRDLWWRKWHLDKIFVSSIPLHCFLSIHITSIPHLSIHTTRTTMSLRMYQACPSESGTEVGAPLFSAVELCDFSGRWQFMSGEIWYILDSGSVLLTEAEAR
jgi:hypothetical protein